MKILKLFAFLLFFYLLQITVFSRFEVLGVRPDILLIVTTLLAVTYGAEEGFVVGILCGIISDIFGGLFYINTVSKGLLGFLVGTFKESVLGTEEAVSLTAVLAATMTNFIIELLLLFFFFGKPIASIPVILITLTVSCFYNGILSVIFVPALKWSGKLIYS
jgi:rod shape-determining protein MreD